MRARWLASRTRSKRFSTLSMQSSTVTRAIGGSSTQVPAAAGTDITPAGALGIAREGKRKGVLLWSRVEF